MTHLTPPPATPSGSNSDSGSPSGSNAGDATSARTSSPAAATTAAASGPSRDDAFWPRLRAVAFWSVVVGIVLELALLGVAAYADRLPAGAAAFAQVAGKVTWSSIVCIGISCGLSLAHSRERLMGLLGAVSGPVGFTVARSVHKGTLQAMSNAPEAVVLPDVLPPFALAALKAVEYGVFGYWLGRIARDERAPLGRFVRAGFVIGVVFGAVFLALYRRARPEADAVEVISKAVNELVFPVGCAVVLYVARRSTAAARTA